METTVANGSKVYPDTRLLKLLVSILDLFKSGARTTEWLNERLQAIIDEADPMRAHRDFWEERFPGKSQVITELLAPFYHPELLFELKLPAHDLEQRCRKAIFWRDIAGIKVVDKDSLQDSLGGSLGDSLQDSLGASLQGSLGVSPQDSLGGSLVDNLGNSLGGSLRDGLGDGLGNNLVENLWDSLETSLFYACAFAIAGDEEKDFRPLFGLWLSGNLPVGFDKEGNLLVLCATSAD